MTFTELRSLIAADQCRYEGGVGWKNFSQEWFRESGFRFTVVMRWCTFLRAQWWSRWVIFSSHALLAPPPMVKHAAYISSKSQTGPAPPLSGNCSVSS
jgi:hypothetical protein